MTIDFESAQARAQACVGDRLEPAGWQLLESTRRLEHYLHAARGTVLASRVEPLSPASSPHFIERSMRREWRREVSRVTGWVPKRWRPAVGWTSRLADLPALSWLERGGRVMAWMQDDESLAPFALADETLRRREYSAAGLEALLEPGDLAAGWLDQFMALLPDDGAAGQRLRDWIDRVERYRAGPGQADLDAAAHARERERLEEWTIRLIRRSLAEPVTVFSHLLLVALDLERLRGGMVRRALFNDPQAI